MLGTLLGLIVNLVNHVVQYIPLISLVSSILFLILWYVAFPNKKYADFVLFVNHMVYVIDIVYIVYALLFASVPITSIYLVLASFAIASLLAYGRLIVQSTIAVVVLALITLKYTDIATILDNNTIAIGVLFAFIALILQVLKNTITI